jgi:hypothetical protein
MKKSSILFLFCILFFSSYASNQIVTNNNNSGAGSLRQAIADASSGDTITFELSSDNEIIALESELSITKSLIINGHNDAGSGTAITIQVTTPGTSAWRVFNITGGTNINLSNMTIKGGDISGNGGAIYKSASALNLENVVISDSEASSGGGIYSGGGCYESRKFNYF